MAACAACLSAYFDVAAHAFVLQDVLGELGQLTCHQQCCDAIAEGAIDLVAAAIGVVLREPNFGCHFLFGVTCERKSVLNRFRMLLLRKGSL